MGCPPVNILLNPDLAENDKRREQMAEHLKACKACQELKAIIGDRPRTQPRPPVAEFGKLLREVTYTIVHLYRSGYPKCRMMKDPEGLASLVHDMLCHQQAVVDSLGPLSDTDSEDIINLWVLATKGALLLLFRGLEDLDEEHSEAQRAWSKNGKELRTLIEKFDGPCQNRPKPKKIRSKRATS